MRIEQDARVSALFDWLERGEISHMLMTSNEALTICDARRVNAAPHAREGRIANAECGLRNIDNRNLNI